MNKLMIALAAALLLGVLNLSEAKDAKFPPVPEAPHGGKVVKAETIGKHDDKVEQFYFEIVNDAKGLKIYPYVLVPRQVPSFLKVAPSVELTNVTVSVGTKPVTVTVDQEGISAASLPKDASGKVQVNATYKGEKKTAEAPLSKGV